MKKQFNRFALFAAFSAIVAGCTTLLNTQANFAADQAEQIARNCPVAGEKAAEARQAANKAENLSNSLNNLANTSRDLQAARDRFDASWAVVDSHNKRGRYLGKRLEAAQERDAAGACRQGRCGECWAPTNVDQCVPVANRHDAMAVEFEGQADDLLFYNPDNISETIRSYELTSARCSRNADKWRQHAGRAGTPDGLEDCFVNRIEADGVTRGSQCQGSTACAAQAENEARWGREYAAEAEATRSEHNAQREQAQRAAADYVGLKLTSNRQVYELRELIRAEGREPPEQNSQVTAFTTIVQELVEGLSRKSQEALAEARQVAAEQCGEGVAATNAPPEPPPMPGGYQQDIYNSQSLGLPGGPAPLVCPASCLTITTSWCSTNCLSSPGDPPSCTLCGYCASQGCP